MLVKNTFKVSHGKHLNIDSNHVILTGLIPQNEVIETFQKGRFKFLIQDRVRKKTDLNIPSPHQKWTKYYNPLRRMCSRDGELNSHGEAYMRMDDFANGLRDLGR